jgi:hypothetical protein
MDVARSALTPLSIFWLLVAVVAASIWAVAVRAATAMACRPLQLAQFLSLLLLAQAVRVLLVSTPPVATAVHPLLLVKAQSVVVAEASRAVTGESVVQVAVLVWMV